VTVLALATLDYATQIGSCLFLVASPKVTKASKTSVIAHVFVDAFAVNFANVKTALGTIILLPTLIIIDRSFRYFLYYIKAVFTLLSVSS
jgi:threonine/homoserine/homoserine lactone efflux protein